ncbi:DUF5133 domain-containing protein [Streptomyces sp. NBC_01220]|uniref:DUF5133 domain-containing protein n=1 Tax=Streptomyces sp. NBC_01220 TaxID=2903781 RepID=UPI00352EFAA1|nr:DUF5133 domain-containing protein [Streptomyces sp. NBC_01220]
MMSARIPRNPEPGGGNTSPEAAASAAQPPIDEPRAAWAVGTVMAAIPCSARDAGRVLGAAARAAGVTSAELAAAMAADARGVAMPARVERALHRAVAAARALPPRAAYVGLMPSRARTAEVLEEFRGCQSRLTDAPSDMRARQALDDAAYTLCVLLGRTGVHDAVLAAEEHLTTGAGGGASPAAGSGGVRR